MQISFYIINIKTSKINLIINQIIFAVTHNLYQPETVMSAKSASKVYKVITNWAKILTERVKLTFGKSKEIIPVNSSNGFSTTLERPDRGGGDKLTSSTGIRVNSYDCNDSKKTF